MSVNEEHQVTNVSFAAAAFTESCNREFNMIYSHKHEKKVYSDERVKNILGNLRTNLKTYEVLFEQALIHFQQIGDKGLWTKDKSHTTPNCPKICKHIQALIDSISSIPGNELDEKMAVQIKRQFGHVIGKLRRNYPAFCIDETWYDMYVQKMNDMIKRPLETDKKHYTSGLNIIFNSGNSKNDLFKDFDEYLYITRMFKVIPTDVRYKKHIQYVTDKKKVASQPHKGPKKGSTEPLFKSERKFSSGEKKFKSEKKFPVKTASAASELSTETLLMQMKSMQLSM